MNQVITVDIHSPQTEGFFSIPVDCLTARFLFERSVDLGESKKQSEVQSSEWTDQSNVLPAAGVVADSVDCSPGNVGNLGLAPLSEQPWVLYCHWDNNNNNRQIRPH